MEQSRANNEAGPDPNESADDGSNGRIDGLNNEYEAYEEEGEGDSEENGKKTTNSCHLVFARTKNRRQPDLTALFCRYIRFGGIFARPCLIGLPKDVVTRLRTSEVARTWGQ